MYSTVMDKLWPKPQTVEEQAADYTKHHGDGTNGIFHKIWGGVEPLGTALTNLKYLPEDAETELAVSLIVGPLGQAVSALANGLQEPIANTMDSLFPPNTDH